MFGVVKETLFIFRGGGNDLTRRGGADNQKQTAVWIFFAIFAASR